MTEYFNEELCAGVIAVLGAFVSWFIGPIDGVVKVLLVMVIVDYVSGIMKGIITKTLSSWAGFRGIAHKVLIFSFVGIANVVDRELMGSTDVIRDGVCLFYISMEGISLFENAIAIGIPIPDALKNVFLEWHTKHQKLEDKPKPKKHKAD